MQINQIDDRSICFNKLHGVVVTVVLRGSIQTTISALVFEYLKYDDAMLIEQMEILLFTEYQMVLQCGLQMLRVFQLFILLLSKVQKDKTWL